MDERRVPLETTLVVRVARHPEVEKCDLGSHLAGQLIAPEVGLQAPDAHQQIPSNGSRPMRWFLRTRAAMRTYSRHTSPTVTAG